MIQKLKQIFQPGSMDPDEARIEYALKINLFSIMVVAVLLTAVSLAGHLFSLILFDTFITVVLITLFFAMAFFLSLKGYWKIMRIIPVGIFFLIAVYGNYVGGIGAPAMIIYVLAILFASQLYGRRMQTGILLLSIISFITLAMLHKNGVIPAARTEEATYMNRVHNTVVVMLGIGILLRFILTQLEETVLATRRNEQELAAANEELQAANEEFEAQNEELARVNQDLERSEENFRTFFESSPIPIGLHRNGILLLVNRAFADLAGEKLNKIKLGGSMLEYVAPEERERVARYMAERSRSNEAPMNYETVVIRKDGTRVDCEININFVAMDNKPATIVFIQNITERKESENLLRENEGKLKSIFQAVPVGIGLLENRRFTRVNTALLKMTGYTEEELLGELTEIIYPDKETFIKKGKEIYEAVQREGLGHMEMPMRKKNGETFHAYFGLAPSDPDDPAGPYCATALDISDRKKAELEKEKMQEQLLQAQKMEAIGTLTGGIAHDFNNILTGIMGSLTMLEKQLAQKEQEGCTKYIEMARESSHRAADMTRQLLALSRKSELKLEAVNLNNSLKHIKKLCQNSFPKSVKLDFRTADSPLYIKGDPVQIEQVLLNLCLNASQAMTLMRPEGERQGGTMTVMVEERLCSPEVCALNEDIKDNESCVVITVKDTGTGIDEENRHKIFDPFFTTKTPNEGTGLGLAMVYGIVTQHGGHINLHSEPGQGTVFTLSFPSFKARESVVEKPNHAEAVQGSGTILVIDDEMTILNTTRAILEGCGYQVYTSPDGTEGLNEFQSRNPGIDGVLLDLSMPGMSGMEVFTRLKELDPTVRVVMTSGLMEEEELEKARALGLNDFIQKPYTATELSKKMKEVLEG